jgi:hypothetical protein
MAEANIRTTNALNIRVVDPISTEVPRATMKLTPATMDALHALREARAVTIMINRKSTNRRVTCVTTSMPVVLTFVVALKTTGPRGIRQRWRDATVSVRNMWHSLLDPSRSALQAFDPS